MVILKVVVGLVGREVVSRLSRPSHWCEYILDAFSSPMGKGI